MKKKIKIIEPANSPLQGLLNSPKKSRYKHVWYEDTLIPLEAVRNRMSNSTLSHNTWRVVTFDCSGGKTAYWICANEAVINAKNKSGALTILQTIKNFSTETVSFKIEKTSN